MRLLCCNTNRRYIGHKVEAEKPRPLVLGAWDGSEPVVQPATSSMNGGGGNEKDRFAS
jgi:hypothetical protein